MFKKMLSRAKIDINILLLPTMFFIIVLSLPAIALAKPVILYTDILTGPNTGGENNNGIYLSIFGKNFGQSNKLGTTTRVYINNTEVASYKYLGTSYGRSDIQQLSIQPGAGVSSGAIKVAVNGVDSNTDHTFTVKPGDIYFVNNVTGNQLTGVIGNINKPFRYPQETFNSSGFGPGDYIVMRGTGTNWAFEGDDSHFLKIYNKLGEKDNYFGIMGYPGELVNIPRTLGGNKVIKISGGTNGHFSLSGLRLTKVEPYTYIPNSSNALHISFAGEAKSYIRIVNLFLSGAHSDVNGNIAIGVADGDGISFTKVLGIHMYDNGLPYEDSLKPSSMYVGNGHDYEFAWNHFEKQNYGKGGMRVKADGSGLVYNVLFHDNIISDSYSFGTMIDKNGGSGFEIYNNTYSDCGSGYLSGNHDGYGCIRILDPKGQNTEVKIYNNVIYNNKGSYAIRVEYDSTIVDIRNNIIYDEIDRGYYAKSGNPTVTGGNNLYFGSAKPLPSWDSNPVTEDPLFIDLSGRDFHLQSGSPAIDTGLNLSQVTNDHDGNPRPMDGDDNGTATQDIGPYEYTGTYIPPQGDSTPPSPPTGLLVVQQ